MRVLITGITGFVGGHLAERLVAEGVHEIAGLSRRAVWPADLSHLQRSVSLHAADLHDESRLLEVLSAVRPEWLFHLAGYAKTGESYREPEACWRANLDGTRTLYQAIARSGLKPRILFASTGLVYGEPDPGRSDLDESAVLKPASPYAASKAAADLLSYQVTRTAGLDVVRIRLFNQIGPRQSSDYAIANFARQIAAIEAGEQPPVLETGDLSAYRDLTDVRDMTAALRAAIEFGDTAEVYNAGRGEVWRIAEVLNRLVALSRVKLEIRSKVEPRRTSDTAISRADPAKLRTKTGWRPQFELDATLADILEGWRNVKGSSP
jgi:GDP-4-dehydro-6-deoxy-D-mannose reductase